MPFQVWDIARAGRQAQHRPLLQFIRPTFAAFAAHCWEKNTWRSMGYLALDVAIVAGLAVVAGTVNQAWLWPLYWFAQGTMFWALFVVGHDW